MYKKKKIAAVLFFADAEKAFNWLEWNFLKR